MYERLPTNSEVIFDNQNQDQIKDEQQDLEEQEGLLNLNTNHNNDDTKSNSRPKWLIPVLLVSILCGSAIIGVIAALTYEHSSSTRSLLPLTIDNLFNGTFTPYKSPVKWVNVANSTNGVYGINDDDAIVLVDLTSATNRTLVEHKDVLGIDKKPLKWDSWELSSDGKQILFKTDTLNQWRYSTYANYYIHSLEDNKTHPLTGLTNPPSVSIAKWSTVGHALAYVKGHNLFIVHGRDIDNSTTKAVQITYDGSPVVFNGINDWAYEEEVFNTDDAIWWNPESSMIAFLKINEERVREYEVPIYNPTLDSQNVEQYPEELRIRYPKPGTPNPTVTIQVYSLVNERNFNLIFPNKRDDRIIIEVAWTSKLTLLVKETSRDSRIGSAVLFDFRNIRDNTSIEGKTVRQLESFNEQGNSDNGWIDTSRSIKSVPSNKGDGYVDLIPNKHGFNHIAFFKSSNSSDPQFLTSGEWEIESILGVNKELQRIYFLAAYPSSIERNILSVKLPQNDLINVQEKDNPKVITDTTELSKFDASFSPASNYYLLNYDGPNVPTQVIKKINDESFNHIIEINDGLNQTLIEHVKPEVIYDNIEINGFKFQTSEIRPPGMSELGDKKYPVLFQIYGGPGSQVVSLNFKRDWSHYLACSKNYIVVYVDVRGSGFKGRKFRNEITNKLGSVEVEDVIGVAKYWAKKSYVDTSKIGVWGWSYGGYLSAKLMEADSGAFSLGISVAPVTDWKLYDSIYTERYLSIPKENGEGYNSSAVHVSEASGFNNVSYALAHGTGDDNVHFAHTAHLLDMLTANDVENFEFRAFTDSNHSINTRNSHKALFEWLTSFLDKNWKLVKKGKKSKS